MTVQRRTRGLSLAATGSPQSMRRRINAGLRDLDRSKVITKPSVFSDSSKLPDARKNGGRIVFVKQANGSYQGQYSDGLTWNSFLASSVSFDTPAVTYGTSYSAGTSSKTIRSNSQLKYPSSVLTNNDDTKYYTLVSDNVFALMLQMHGWNRLEFWGDGLAGTNLGIEGMGVAGDKAMNIGTGGGLLSGSERATITCAAGVAADCGLDFQLQTAGNSGDFLFNSVCTPNTTTNAMTTFMLDPSSASNANIAASVLMSTTTALSARTLRAYDVNYQSMSADFTGTCKFVGYGMSSFSLQPGASSSATLSAYGAEFAAPTLTGANGTFTEHAALALRAGTGSNVTLGLGAKVEYPRASTTTQVGIDMVNIAGGSTPTDRYGIRVGALTRGTNRYGVTIKSDSTGTPTLDIGLDVEARSVGTTRWAIRTTTDSSQFAGITMVDATDVVLGTGTGTKIGTGTTQKLGFWNVAPVVQPATTGTASSMTAGGGAAVDDKATFTGGLGATAYRIDDVVLGLKQCGILKQ